MKRSSVQRGNGLGRIFAMPLALALALAFGLLSALLGDGVWDVLSWFALATPLVVAGWHVLKN